MAFLVALRLAALVVYQESHVIPLAAANGGRAQDTMRRQQFDHQIAAEAPCREQAAAAQNVT